MTYEEALAIAEYGLQLYREKYAESTIIEFQKTVINVLKKQVPKKPIIKFSLTNTTGISSEELITSCYCPICGRYFGDKGEDFTILFHTPEYCEQCGQKLDWSEGETENEKVIY